MVRSAVSIALLLTCASAARIIMDRTQANESSAPASRCPAEIPQFRTYKWQKAGRACGVPAWGTLAIGLVKATGLKNADGMLAGTTDPYARFRLSDAHWREMRGFFAKNKPVAVTDDMLSTEYLNTVNPVWKETFMVDLFCPHLPFGPQQAPMGPKPSPIVAFHPKNNKLNDGKSGHTFQLELTLKDADAWNSDDSVGRVKIPLADLVIGNQNGLQTYQLTGAQGSVELLIHFCARHDSACQAEREAAFSQQGLSVDNVRSKVRFDCQLGCHTLLQPKRGRIAMYVEYARRELNKAIQQHQAHIEADQNQEAADAAGDQAVHGIIASAGDVNETKRLQEEWANSEKLEEMYDEQSDAALANRENAWAQAALLAKQLGALDGLGSQFCSASPIFSNILRWAAESIRTFTNDKWGRLSGLYNQKLAEEMDKEFTNLENRLQSLETCMVDRWFQDGQLILNQWESTPKCHKHFNLWKGSLN